MKLLPLALLGIQCFVSNGQYESTNLRRAGLSIGEFVDSESCYSAIAESVDGEEGKRMNAEAYVDFVKAYGPENFLEDTFTFEELPLILESIFNLLACLCSEEEGEGQSECCVGDKAGIETNGAISEDPSDEQKSYLFKVCAQTSNGIDRVIQSVYPSEAPTTVNDPTIEKEVVVTYKIGVEKDDSAFEDYDEELISAMDSMAPTLLPEARKRQLRVERNLQSIFLPTTIKDHTMIGKLNASTFMNSIFRVTRMQVWSYSYARYHFSQLYSTSPLLHPQTVLRISLSLHFVAKPSQPLSFSCFSLRRKNPAR